MLIKPENIVSDLSSDLLITVLITLTDRYSLRYWEGTRNLLKKRIMDTISSFMLENDVAFSDLTD